MITDERNNSDYNNFDLAKIFLKTVELKNFYSLDSVISIIVK